MVKIGLIVIPVVLRLLTNVCNPSGSRCSGTFTTLSSGAIKSDSRFAKGLLVPCICPDSVNWFACTNSANAILVRCGVGILRLVLAIAGLLESASIDTVKVDD